eukprot:COSAG02_NODE_495_length_21151_cov_31.954256_12_plen_83_part_00
MLAMALLPHGGLLGGVGGEAAGVDGSGEGAWTLATLAEGLGRYLGERGRQRFCRAVPLYPLVPCGSAGLDKNTSSDRGRCPF